MCLAGLCSQSLSEFFASLFFCVLQITTEGGAPIVLDGANPSAEEADEGTDDQAQTGINIVFAHQLNETSFTKAQYKTHMKEYSKAVLKYLEQENPDRAPIFKANFSKMFNKLFVVKENPVFSVKDLQWFNGASFNPDGMAIWAENDGVEPKLYYWKDGLVAEKFVSIFHCKI